VPRLTETRRAIRRRGSKSVGLMSGAGLPECQSTMYIYCISHQVSIEVTSERAHSKVG